DEPLPRGVAGAGGLGRSTGLSFGDVDRIYGRVRGPTVAPAQRSTGFTTSVISALGPSLARAMEYNWRTALPTIIGTPSASASSRQSRMSLLERPMANPALNVLGSMYFGNLH